MEPKIYIFQTDNRGMSADYPFDYIQSSIRGNLKVCQHMGWEHVFRDMKPEYFSENHPALAKIYVVNDWLQEKVSNEPSENPSFMVFLDTDAWVNDAARLQQLIKEMVEQGKQGAFSRDPYIRKNTFINSGSFIMKIDAYAVKMYERFIAKVKMDPGYLYRAPWDQYYISQEIWEHCEDFWIFKPEILNTGYGKILRHNWLKTSRKIRDDLYSLCVSPIILDQYAKGVVEDELDDEAFPNLAESGYEYMDFD